MREFSITCVICITFYCSVGIFSDRILEGYKTPLIENCVEEENKDED